MPPRLFGCVEKKGEERVAELEIMIIFAPVAIIGYKLKCGWIEFFLRYIWGEGFGAFAGSSINKRVKPKILQEEHLRERFYCPFNRAFLILRVF